jgi:hypothetical protein
LGIVFFLKKSFNALKKNRQLVACTAHIPTTFSHWKSGWSVLNQEKLIFNHILTKKKTSNTL